MQCNSNNGDECMMMMMMITKKDFFRFYNQKHSNICNDGLSQSYKPHLGLSHPASWGSHLVPVQVCPFHQNWYHFLSLNFCASWWAA